ncbi:MAG: DHH family phosphoesterase [Ruminococcus sp.]|nr:DHH family phosphoesterase [Ruminococcus sp.]
MKSFNNFQIITRITTAVILFSAIVSSYILYDTPVTESQGKTLLWISIIAGIILGAETVLFWDRTKKYIAKTSTMISKTERDSLLNFPAPVIIVDEEFNIIWYNKIFAVQVYSEEEAYGLNICDLVNIDINKIFTSEGDLICLDKHFYKARAIHNNATGTLSMIYFDNVTDYVELEYQHRQSHKSVIMITIDNYEDLMSNLRESEKAHAFVEIERLIENFLDGTNGISKKISNDKFYVILEEQHLSKIIENRFKILDEAKRISIGEKGNITLSIGVGYNSKNLAESETFAKQALEMCLGRGGDQAAVKTDGGFEFFGGVSNGMEKHTKVKTRMVANALIELFNSHEKILIMGHRFGDLDSIGAATGMCSAVRKMGKEAYVVVDNKKVLAQSLIQHITDNDIARYYVSPEVGLSKINDATLLIVVDTHNPDLVESPDILARAKDVVVIDHHRLMVKAIDKSVLFYHEPIASSASEMVAELIEYFGSDAKISVPVAEGLLAGIMLDTKNFVLKTGVRTFEAAAFLRKMGSDTVAVKKLFANSIETYQNRSDLITSAEIYRKCAITMTDKTFPDIRIASSQAADELLGIKGVNAAFVIYKENGRTNISARSLGGFNVQIIMENMGGGGHLTMAATSLDATLEDAKAQLRNNIDEYIRNNS